MEITRQVVVLDAAELAPVSSFWAAVLGGRVIADDDDGWHSVLDADGEWRMGVQLAPDHEPPDWPDGAPGQQLHLDLHVRDAAAAHEELLGLGARVLAAPHDLDSGHGHRTYADPAGHPFCIGWGQPPAGPITGA